MNSRVVRCLGLAAAVLTLAAAGCGGSDGKSSSDGSNDAGGDTKTVSAIVLKAGRGGMPDDICPLYSEAGIKDFFQTRAQCELKHDQPRPEGEIAVDNTVVTGDRATAVARNTKSGRTFAFTLSNQGGKWLIDKIVETTPGAGSSGGQAAPTAGADLGAKAKAIGACLQASGGQKVRSSGPGSDRSFAVVANMPTGSRAFVGLAAGDSAATAAANQLKGNAQYPAIRLYGSAFVAFTTPLSGHIDDATAVHECLLAAGYKLTDGAFK
jgi:hypothetical protein